EGSIVGTLQYMSPEQLEGKESDARSDIFALGAIMYEMVTGKRAFEAGSQAGLVAAILTQNPASTLTVQPSTPLLLDHVIKKCLVKSPDQRWQNAADILIELELATGNDKEIPTNARPERVGRREIVAWALAGAAVLAAGVFAALMWQRSAKTTEAPIMRF